MRPDGATITEMAKAVDAPISSVQGFINGLVATGYLNESDRRYRLGAGPYVLALRSRGSPGGIATHADLETLSQQTGCDVLVAIRVGDDLVYVDEVGSSTYLQYLSRTRSRRPLTDTVAGHIFLSRMAPDELDYFLASQSDHDKVSTILHEIDNIRRDGVLVRLQSWRTDAATIGVPIDDQHGRIVEVLLLGGDRTAIEPRVSELVSALEAARNEWCRRRANVP